MAETSPEKGARRDRGMKQLVMTTQLEIKLESLEIWGLISLGHRYRKGTEKINARDRMWY